MKKHNQYGNEYLVNADLRIQLRCSTFFEMDIG